MVGPGGLTGQEYGSWKNIKKNWRFLLCSSIVIGVVLYLWAR